MHGNYTDGLPTVGVDELRRHLGAYLDRVEAGECIVVTRYGKAVAVLVPIPLAREMGIVEEGEADA